MSCKKEDVEIIKPEPPQLPPVTMKLKPVSFPINNVVGGYYVGLPSDYDSNTKRHPLLVFIPGAGQFGNGTNDLHLLLKDGPAQLIDEGIFPTNLKINGEVFNFIVFTPQLRYWPNTSSIKESIDYAKNKYRIDSTRIYISGLSIGGTLSCDLGADYTSSIAAIVPMAGVSLDFEINNKCNLIAGSNLPVWAFHSNDDVVFSIAAAKNFVSKINSYNPLKKSKITIWPSGGHDAWTRALEPGFRENGMNIYEWMLQHKR
jgi:predicted peptidase